MSETEIVDIVRDGLFGALKARWVKVDRNIVSGKHLSVLAGTSVTT